MVFLGEQSSGNPNLLINKFKNINGSDCVYVIWSRTKPNYTVSGYSLSLSGGPTSATKVELVPGDTEGVNSAFNKHR